MPRESTWGPVSKRKKTAGLKKKLNAAQLA